MKMRAWSLAATAGAVLALAAGASADLVARGKTVPAWSGKTVQGKPISSAQFKNKVVLMNFFSYS